MLKEIKKGFFIGLGLIVPLLFVHVIVVKYSVYEMSNLALEGYDEVFGDLGEYTEEFVLDADEAELIKKVSLSNMQEALQGKQLLVTGQFTNNSEQALNSLEIEVELFDESGAFVYECSKSFYEKMPVGVTQNYLVKCGCSEHGVPSYSSVKVNVIRASVY